VNWAINFDPQERDRLDPMVEGSGGKKKKKKNKRVGVIKREYWLSVRLKADPEEKNGERWKRREPAKKKETASFPQTCSSTPN